MDFRFLCIVTFGQKVDFLLLVTRVRTNNYTVGNFLESLKLIWAIFEFQTSWKFPVLFEMGETIFKNVFFSLVYEQEMSYTHATLLGVSENQGHRNVKHFGGDMLNLGWAPRNLSCLEFKFDDTRLSYSHKNKIGRIGFFLLLPDFSNSLPCWLSHQNWASQ